MRTYVRAVLRRACLIVYRLAVQQISFRACFERRLHVKMDRETLSKFIERYKFHTCLWNVSSADYMNKQKRINALQDLVPILGEAATIDSVRKKIDIIRNGYYRELKKVNASSSTGTSANNVYTPTLWYYDLMSFLSSEEVSRPGTDGLDEPANAASGGDPGRIRRKKRTSTKTQEELVNVAKKLLTEDNPNAADQDNAFGLYLNTQLKKLTSDQRIIAEKLMSDVLFMARSNQLNASSQIITRPSPQITNTISEYTSSPIQNITSPYTEYVHSLPNTHILTPMRVSKRPISQNSAHSSSSSQHITSPYTEDVRSPPNTYISTPMTVSKRPISQNSSYSSSSTQYITSPYTEDVDSPPNTYISTPMTVSKRPISQNSSYSSSTQYITSPYTEDVDSPPNTYISTPMTVSKRTISQNSVHSSSPIQYITSPYTEDVRSPPQAHTSSSITITRPPSQSTTPIQYSSTSKSIETQGSHKPSSQTVLSANSLIQYQDTLQELPNTQFSSIPITFDGETENSAPVHTEDVNKSILNQLLIFKKK